MFAKSMNSKTNLIPCTGQSANKNPEAISVVRCTVDRISWRTEITAMLRVEKPVTDMTVRNGDTLATWKVV